MTKRKIRWVIPGIAIVLSLLSLAALAHSQTTMARGGIFPAGATLSEVARSGLRFVMRAPFPNNSNSASNPSVSSTTLTAAGSGVFPTGTTFSGVALSGLRFGIGVELPGDGTANGFFDLTLVGASAIGTARSIVVDGYATSGSKVDGRTTYAGTCTVNLGDGTPPLTAVPYAISVTKLLDGNYAITVTLDATSLPAAAVTSGSITVN